MGGNSTSHSAVLSDKKTQSSGAFDLQSWQGLTALLKTGKEALQDPSEYASFRNLVLQYAQHGGDIELKQQILDTVRSFTEVPASPMTTEVPEQKSKDSFLPRVAHTELPKKPQSESSVSTRRLLPRFEE